MTVTEIQLFDKVYRNSLTLLLTADPLEVDKYLDDIGFAGDRLDHATKQAAYYRIRPEENHQDNNGNLIWMRSKNIPCLVHELSHFIIQEFDDKTIPITLENDEVFCYYVEFWTNEVIESWQDWNYVENNVDYGEKR